MSSPWASVVPDGTVPKDYPPPFRRPLCPSWRAGFAPIPTKSERIEGIGLDSLEVEARPHAHRPGPAVGRRPGGGRSQPVSSSTRASDRGSRSLQTARH